MSRVFVACHAPSRHGKVTWEGHEIVGYVDVIDGRAVKGDAPYFRGWDSIPKELFGTVDIVLAMFCPVAPALRRGDLTTLDSPPPADSMNWVRDAYEVLTKSFALLRPGGYILFPRADTIAPGTLALLPSAEVVDIPKPRWIRHRQSDDRDVNEDYSVETLRGFKVPKPAAGGRRRKTRRRRYSLRSRRKSIKS
jgi:hypothetical protein